MSKKTKITTDQVSEFPAMIQELNGRPVRKAYTCIVPDVMAENGGHVNGDKFLAMIEDKLTSQE